MKPIHSQLHTLYQTHPIHVPLDRGDAIPPNSHCQAYEVAAAAVSIIGLWQHLPLVPTYVGAWLMPIGSR